jgi:hypothetical protein
MKSYTDTKGLWIMTTESDEEIQENNTPVESQEFRDAYDYFPDFGI